MGMRVTTTGLALVWLAGITARVHSTNRHPAVMLQHADLHFIRIASASVLVCDNFNFATRGRLCSNMSKYAVDLNRLSGGDHTVPLEVILPVSRGTAHGNRIRHR